MNAPDGKGQWVAWLRRLARSVGQAVIVALFVCLVTFVIVRLVPGDPAVAILGHKASPEAIAKLRAELGVTRPIATQLLEYIGGVAHGDLGRSIVQQGSSVMSIILAGLPVTLPLMGGGILIAILIGVPMGVAAGVSRRPAVDGGVRAAAVLFISTPTPFLSLVLLSVFALRLGWVPAGGWGRGWPENLEYLILPSVALAGALAPFIARTVRQAVLDTSGQPFIEAAVARGISERRVTRRHILPNSLLPVLTLLGLNIGMLVTGAVVAEAVFDMPGLGSALVSAMNNRDYPVIQGIAIATALIVVVGNLLTDAMYVIADPRVRRA